LNRFQASEQVALNQPARLFLSAALRNDANKEENLSMKKSVLQGATKQGMPKADSNSVSRVRQAHSSPPSIPRWVKVLTIIALVLFLLFMILRFTLIPYLHSLSGHTGFGSQTLLTSLIVYGGHQV
jgi:hypothetical protein